MPWPQFTRRRLLSLAGGAFVGSTALGVYVWRVEPHWLHVVERPLPIAQLPDAWIGKRIVQLSDLHVGPFVDPEHLRAALDTAAALEPDVTVITGDFMTCRGTEQLDGVSTLFNHFSPSPWGCFASLGNHDYGHRWRRTEVADQLVQRLADRGITTLRNECRAVHGLQFVGLEDLWGPHFQPRDMLAQVDWQGPTLTLSHNPDSMDRPEMAVVRGWVLAGHTHGGQCKPPFLPPPILPVKNRRYSVGEIEVDEHRRLYINPGLGYLHRVRLNVRPEITVFHVVRA